MLIYALKYGDNLWEETARYADNCSWQAGPYLAKQMRNNVFSDWERVFVGVYEAEICCYCTLSKTDCIPDVDYSPFIGFMFVGEEHRGQRFSQRLIEFAMEYARSLGFERVYLASDEKGLYEKYGFMKIADKQDYSGRMEQIFTRETV